MRELFHFKNLMKTKYSKVLTTFPFLQLTQMLINFVNDQKWNLSYFFPKVFWWRQSFCFQKISLQMDIEIFHEKLKKRQSRRGQSSKVLLCHQGLDLETLIIFYLHFEFRPWGCTIEVQSCGISQIYTERENSLEIQCCGLITDSKWIDERSKGKTPIFFQE